MKNYKLIFKILLFQIFVFCHKNIWKGVLNNYSVQSEYFTLRGNLIFIANAKKNNLRLQIRFHRNKIIWISLTGPFGVEVLRILIKKNKIYLINKLENKLYNVNYEKLNNLLGFKVTFKLIQDIILSEINKNIRNQEKIFSKIYHKKINNLLYRVVSSDSKVYEEIIINVPGVCSQLSFKYYYDKNKIFPYIKVKADILLYLKNLRFLNLKALLKNVNVQSSKIPLKFPFRTLVNVDNILA